MATLQWQQKERLKSSAFRLLTQPYVQAQIKENITDPRHWLCDGNSPVTGEFPAQKTSNAEDVSIWWRHRGETNMYTIPANTKTFMPIDFQLT